MSQAIGNTALAYARVWHHVDASERVLGRMASRIAQVLMGKHKPMYDAGADCGDYVVVTNARNVLVTGRKSEQVKYYKHTMYPGGLQTTPYRDLMQKRPDEIIRHAVSGMLPKNKLRQRRLDRLRIFPDEEMGPFKINILRRWEDGTLRTAKVPQPNKLLPALVGRSVQ
ncbi:60S ribosomal protein L23 [Auriculariales sp. MPI-PUGE-AT-0066]|nr:60S ribosomal protein L23 [Auriculariales sp. MPI-PUGE-AT-0066]